MPITISRKKIRIVLGDAEFTLKDFSDIDFEMILNKYVDKGKINPEKFTDCGMAFLESFMLDWKGVTDETTREEVKFEKELIRELPVTVINRLHEKLFDYYVSRREKVEEELKNSQATLSKEP